MEGKLNIGGYNLSNKAMTWGGIKLFEVLTHSFLLEHLLCSGHCAKLSPADWVLLSSAVYVTGNPQFHWCNSGLLSDYYMSSTILCWDTAVSRTKFQLFWEGQIKIRHTPLYSFSQTVLPSDTLPFQQNQIFAFKVVLDSPALTHLYL